MNFRRTCIPTSPSCGAQISRSLPVNTPQRQCHDWFSHLSVSEIIMNEYVYFFLYDHKSYLHQDRVWKYLVLRDHVKWIRALTHSSTASPLPRTPLALLALSVPALKNPRPQTSQTVVSEPLPQNHLKCLFKIRSPVLVPNLLPRSVSYTHLTLPTRRDSCRSRWSPYH